MTWHLVNHFSHGERSYCRDCGHSIPPGERFCDDCDMRMDLGDSEYQNRIEE